MGQLSDDILKWTLDVNGDPARKELTQVSNSTAKLERDNKSLSREMVKLEAHGRKGSKEWKRYEAQIKANNLSISANKKRMGELRKEVGLNNLSATELRKEMKSLKQQMDRMDPETAEWKKLDGQFKSMKGRLQQVSGGMGKTNALFGAFKKMAPWLSFAALGAALKSVVSKAIDIRTEFSRYEAVLENTLGSQKSANQEFAKLQDFAERTPFQLNELTSSYVKLVNQGFKPTLDEMQSLGDLASAMGKSFDQLTEAIIDAQVGENERLKEFGIRAQKEGDKIKYTFKGITTEVDYNAESIRNYILSLGSMQGVVGGMEKISKTIGGAISNTGDAMDSLFNAIGKRLEPGLVKLLGTWSNLLGVAAKWLDVSVSSTDILIEKSGRLKEIEKQFSNEDETLKRLLGTYDDLSTKETLTKDEQVLLNEAISEIGEIVPTAITEFNKYGEAIGINKDKIIEAREAQRLLNLEMKKDVVDDLVKNIEKQTIALSNANGQIEARNRLLQDEQMMTKVINQSGFDRGTIENNNLLAIKEQNEIVKQKNVELAKTVLKLKDIGLTEEEISVRTGISLQDMADAVDNYIKTVNNSSDPSSDPEQEKLKEAEKLALAKKKEREEALKALELANKKEILALQERYGAEEELQKMLQSRLLANELAYLQAKENLTEDEGQKVSLQLQILNVQQKYNQAIKESADALRLKEVAVEAVNAKLLEEGKLTERNARIASKAATEQEALNEKMTSQAQMYQDTIAVVSDGIFDMMSGSEDAFKNFAKNILIFALEQLKVQAQLAAAGATVQSLAQPDSIATFGATGLARAAVIVGLIEAAFAGLEGLVNKAFTSKKSVSKYASGGFTQGETMYIAGEKGTEWISPNWMLRDPRTASIIGTLEYYRKNPLRLNMNAVQPVKQFADGGFTSPGSSSSNVQAGGFSDPELKELLRQNIRANSEMKSAAEKLHRDGTYTRLLGRDGFLETQKDYDKMRREVSL